MYRDVTYASYNTFGAIHYSDGYKEAAMMPSSPPVLKCVKADCAKLFSLDEAEMIAEPDLKDKLEPEWEAAFNIKKYVLTTDTLREAIALKYGDNESEEQTLRIWLWYRFNDRFRRPGGTEFNRVEQMQYTLNLQRLISLVGKTDDVDHRLYLAELHRQAGEFEKCLEIIYKIKDAPDYIKAVMPLIEKKAKERERRVFRIGG